jgi:GWxTD domain-containing protein
MSRSTAADLAGTPVDPVFDDTSAVQFMVADTSALQSGQMFVHQYRAVVPPGEYELNIRIPGDTASDRLDVTLRRDVVVPDYARADLVRLSDITLASSITPSSNRTGAYYKNGLEITPNANQLFGGGVSQVFYYAEAYNVGSADPAASEYTAFAYVSEANRPQPIAGMESRTKRAVRSPDVLVGSFNVRALPSGSYFLRLALLNDDNEAMVEQSRKFFVYNPDVQRAAPVADEVSFEASEFAALSDEQLDETLKRVDLIATDRERRRIKSIEDGDERRRFLYDFWLVRDPDPSTRRNEFRDEFYRRLQFSNERYTTTFSEGWKSDRGRVVVKHGVPSAIEPHLYDRGVAPHEIWQFNNIPGEGQALFIFADMQGFGEFELIHSTVAGERKSPNWQAELARR